jgi:hypothetical protein
MFEQEHTPEVASEATAVFIGKHVVQDQYLAPEEIASEWQKDALCSQTDAETFFPEKGASTHDAKVVCGHCTVREDCLEYALAAGERYGVWGGKSERERRALLRERQKQAA